MTFPRHTVGSRTAEALGVQLHVLPGLDHDGALTAIDEVMELVAPFLALIP